MANPYLAGKPVKGEGRILGREYELSQLQRAFSDAEPGINQSYALVGPRRIGKTSIAEELVRRLQKSKHLTAFINVQAIPLGQSTPEDGVKRWSEEGTALSIFKAIERELREELRKKIPELAVPLFDLLDRNADQLDPAETFATFRSDLLRLDDAIRDGAHPIGAIILDEVMALNNLQMPAIFGFLRDLVQSFDCLLFIVIGADDLFVQINSYTSPFFNVFSILRIAPVSDQDARLMIEIPAKRAHLDPIEFSAVTRVLNIAGNEPYLINLICRAAVERATAMQENSLRESYVQAAIEAIVAEPKGHLGSIWEEKANGTERVVLYIIASKQRPCSVAEIAVALVEAIDFAAPVAQLDEMLDSLVELQFLRRVEMRYDFVNQLLPAWIRRHRSLQHALAGIVLPPLDVDARQMLDQLYANHVANLRYLKELKTRSETDQELDQMIKTLERLIQDEQKPQSGVLSSDSTLTRRQIDNQQPVDNEAQDFPVHVQQRRRVLKQHLIDAHELLDELERAHIVEVSPITKRRLTLDINRIKDQITQFSEELEAIESRGRSSGKSLL